MVAVLITSYWPSPPNPVFSSSLPHSVPLLSQDFVFLPGYAPESLLVFSRKPHPTLQQGTEVKYAPLSEGATKPW